uniref:Uncharacterized protein n=1 Tax=Avena sativa TaxID=4498 RepID=A0ACD5Y113_AVESA
MTKDLLHDRILNFYEDAFDRLPWEGMSELAQVMSTGGLCVGLLDPVSNIILNTVSLLPPGFQHQLNVLRPRKSRRLAIANRTKKKGTFYDIASRSYLALIGFLLDYFGCLTEEQAGRYLRWADADLALAVLLVEYDLCFGEAERLPVPDPGSGRTQASLELAVRRAGHPAPDRIVQLTASVFPPQRLEAVKPLLVAGGTEVTLDNIYLLQGLIQDSNHAPQGTRCLSNKATDEGAVVHAMTSDYISSLRSHQDMESMRSACLAKAYSLKSSRLKQLDCGESCEHLRSLEMRLQDTVHSLYLDAITMLPRRHGTNNGLIRAGHCYGPLGPVANIIINSIWYSRLCPLPSSARYDNNDDILDTLSMLRIQVRSLEGVMEAVRAMAPTFSTKDVVKSLCVTRCDITQMLRTARSSSSDPFLRAAVAAQHPLPAAISLYHKQLAEDTAKMDDLRSLIDTAGLTYTHPLEDRCPYRSSTPQERSLLAHVCASSAGTCAMPCPLRATRAMLHISRH